MIDNITKLRQVQLELLMGFSDVCEEHDLKWYVFFGTLLGVMRGEGYLPWDDDMDIAMPREDFNNLCMHREWFDERFYLQTPLDQGAQGYAKLRRNGTTAFSGGLTDDLRAGGHHGIPIDIIPLDTVTGTDTIHTPSMRSQKSEVVYHRSWFEPSKNAKFEGLEVRIPAMPRKILNAVYDVWCWPSGARTTRPKYWFFDADKDYTEYVKRYTGMLEGIENKKIRLFGAADSLHLWLERFGMKDRVICTYDNNSRKWGKQTFGVEVRNPAELPEVMDGDTRLIIVSIWHQEIGRQLEDMGISDYFVYLDYLYDYNADGTPVVREEDLTGVKPGIKWIPE